jgi:hypothetical protein
MMIYLLGGLFVLCLTISFCTLLFVSPAYRAKHRAAEVTK